MSSPVPPPIRDLSLLLKHYSALTPSVPSLIPQPLPFPESKTLSLPQTQQWIVQNILPLDQDDEKEGGGTGTGSSLNWKENFWKRVVKGIEEGFEERKKDEEENVEDEEVDSEILERMVEYLSSSSTSVGTNGGLSNRTYYWGPLDLPRNEWNFIQTREEGRMISGGTTGLRTWQACIALGNHFLIDSKIIKSCKNIIELGSGVGVLSLICARIKKKHQTGDDDDEVGKVLATDVDEKVLELLKENVELNGLENEIKTLKLDWELAQIASSGEETSSEKEEADRADLIIGADIVYDPSLTSPLAATIYWLLSRSTSRSQAIIAGTIRNESTWESFLHQCRCRDLKIEEIELKKFQDGSGLVGAEGWEGEGVVRVVRLTL